MAQRVVAIDLSPRVARIAVVEATLRRNEVVALESVPVAEGQSQKEVLAAVRAAVSGPIDSIVIAADARASSSRQLRFPFGDLRKVEAAVAFELEGQVPYDLDETAMAWQVLHRAANATELLAALLPKKGLLELIADAEASCLEPRAVVPAASGLAELIGKSDESVAIASLGDTTSHVAVVRSGLRLVRALRAGGADVDRSLARVFNVELPQAREAKEREVRLLATGASATEEAKRISEAAAAGLAPLVTGLATTFKSLAAADAPSRLLITGGLSRLPGLCDFLSQRLGMIVELLDIAKALTSEPEPLASPVRRLPWRGRPEAVARPPEPERAAIAVGPEHALAVGMALGSCRHGHATPLNFRRGELAYQGDIQLFRGQVTRVAVGVGAVILLAIFGSIVRYTMISAEEERLNAAFCAQSKKMVGREICDPTALLSILKQGPGGDQGVTIPPYSAGTLLEMMSKSIGTDIDVTFDDLELRADGRTGDPDRISGKGEAASFEATEQVAAALKRDPCVQEAEISKQRKTKDGGRVEFNIAVKVSCPPGVLPGKGSPLQADASKLKTPPLDTVGTDLSEGLP